MRYRRKRRWGVCTEIRRDWYRIFAIFLAFLLGSRHLQMPGKAIRIEPEDPITTEPEVLLTEDYSDQVDQGLSSSGRNRNR